MHDWLVPDWPAPANVVAVSTTRSGGVSEGAFGTLNLGAHVADDRGAVAENRRRLREYAGLEREPVWLHQVHGNRVVDADAYHSAPPEADAAWSRATGTACAVLTADCLPVLLADRDGSVVAAAHAGWRGLAAGIIERTITAMAAEPRSLVAWLGPAIAQPAFEVGAEVREAFLSHDAAAGRRSSKTSVAAGKPTCTAWRGKGSTSSGSPAYPVVAYAHTPIRRDSILTADRRRAAGWLH